MKAVLVLLVAAAAFAFSAGAGAESAGAPNSAKLEGCTCHEANPSGMVTVTLDGLPEEYEPGMEYDLTLTIDGPDALPAPIGQNAGGFMVVVSEGALLRGDETDQQNRDEMTLTHTTAGNNQRSWSFSWEAPTDANVTNVTIWYAGNAVNGDTTNGRDAWNMAEMVVPNASPTMANNTTGPPEEPDDGGIPGPSLPAVAFAATVAATVWYRFRRANVR